MWIDNDMEVCMFKCIYCGIEKEDKFKSLEHIFPQSAGGGNLLTEKPFRTRNVCKTCNSTLGLYVDGLFLRSWLYSNLKTLDLDKFIDLYQGTILPLSYMGIIDNLSNDEFLCDYWLGVSGESIFHIHSNYDDKFITQIGGNVINRKKNPGTVYYIPSNINSPWGLTCLKSLKDQFNRQRIIGLNTKIVNGTIKIFDEPIESEKNKWNELKQYLNDNYNENEYVKATVRSKIGFEHRFLAKLAIGIGYNLLGPSYLQTNSYMDLRKMLWSQDLTQREELKIHGSDFSNNIELEEPLKSICRNDCATIMISIDGDIYSLIVSFGGKLNFSIMFLDPQKETSPKFTHSKTCNIYYVFKQIGKAFGPFSDVELISHITNTNPIAELRYIDNLKSNPCPLPIRVIMT